MLRTCLSVAAGGWAGGAKCAAGGDALATGSIENTAEPKDFIMW